MLSRSERKERYSTPTVVPKPPDYDDHIDLSADSKLQLETYLPTSWGFGGVVGHWGREYPIEETQALVAQMYGSDKVMPNGGGFTSLWKVPEAYTSEQAMREELEIGQILIPKALEMHGLQGGQVDYFFLGAGAPLVDHPDIERYGPYVANLVGLDHLDPGAGGQIFDNYTACHSGFANVRKALLEERFQGKVCLFYNVEGLTRFANGMNIDAASRQLFGNGANAFVMVPGETLKIVRDQNGEPIEENGVVPDVGGALAAAVPYMHLIDENQINLNEGRVKQISMDGNLELIILPIPPSGMVLDMDGKETGFVFAGPEEDRIPAKITRVHARDLQNSPARSFVNSPTASVIHAASIDVQKSINERTPADIIFPWGYKLDGNTSASDGTTVWIRSAPEWRPKQKVLWASMGGGTEQGAMMVETGEDLSKLENSDN